MKKLKQNKIQFTIFVDINYSFQKDISLAASSELDSMDISDLQKPIVNFVKGMPFDINSEVYKNFIEFVNKVDELLEKREFEFLGESERQDSDSESIYRGIVLNISKDTPFNHISGKIENTLRLSGHRETRSSRRTRGEKQKAAAESEEAKALNNGEPLIVGEFQSIVVKRTVKFSDKVNIENKEFYTYVDALRCVDQILDRWDD